MIALDERSGGKRVVGHLLGSMNLFLSGLCPVPCECVNMKNINIKNVPAKFSSYSNFF